MKYMKMSAVSQNGRFKGGGVKFTKHLVIFEFTFLMTAKYNEQDKRKRSN